MTRKAHELELDRDSQLAQDLDAGADVLVAAVRILIGAAKLSEQRQQRRVDKLAMDTTIELDDSAIETWTVTVERTQKSTH
jgi:hypothetical protein